MELQKPDALSSLMSQIPKTIRDAIGLVKLLGERYLWVDTLCISQDDSQIKSREIDSMAATYANAMLTIVAADGENSGHGLRGLHGISEQRDIDLEKLVVDFGDKHKLINLDLGNGSCAWASSPYFTRGWVFQEYHFSKRRLIFLNQVMRWECSCDSWQEVVDPYCGLQHRYRPTFLAALESSPTLSKCALLIEDYNDREFTYTEDALPTITGLLAILGQKYLGGFLFGLPEMSFEAALNWDRLLYTKSDTVLTRRTPTSVRIGSSPSCLPSW